MHADLVDVIRSYRSKDLDSHPRGAAIHTVITQLVIDAGPSDAKTARQALRHAAGFYRWLADSGRCDGAISTADLTETHIVDYVDTALANTPQGTRDATRSYLRRCTPGRSLARTGRHGTTAATARDTGYEDTAAGADDTAGTRTRRHRSTGASTFPPDLIAHRSSTKTAVDTGAISAACEAWAPADMDGADWAPLRATCLDWVRAAAPASPSRATQIMRNAAWLLLWGAANGHRPADLLTIASIKAYITAEDLTGPTAEGVRSTMDVVIAALNPEQSWGRRSTGRRAAAIPYSDAQVDWFWNQTVHMGPRLGPSARALIVLGAGFGTCRGAAPSTVTVGDIHRSGDLLALHVERDHGTVELAVIDRWAERCSDLLAELGEEHDRVLLGSTNPKRAGHVADGIGNRAGRPFSQLRLFANWKLNVLCAPQPIATAADAVGMRSLDGFDNVVGYLADHRGHPLGGTR